MFEMIAGWKEAPGFTPAFAGNGRKVVAVRRMGKRIVLELEDDLFLVIHLMIAGRLRWQASGSKVPGKLGLAAFDFPNGTLILTEAGSKRRASLWLVRGEESLEQFARGGLEVLDATLAEFKERLIGENHTLKRSLTDQVTKIKTPTLLMTGEEDYRTPISEAEQFYAALKLLNVEAVLVRVPEEPHGISRRPSHHIAKMLYVAGWFDQHKSKP